MNMQKYLSRDLRQTISETLRQNGMTPTKKLVEDIYDLVLTEAVDAQFLAVEKKLDKRIEQIAQSMRGA